MARYPGFYNAANVVSIVEVRGSEPRSRLVSNDRFVHVLPDYRLFIGTARFNASSHSTTDHQGRQHLLLYPSRVLLYSVHKDRLRSHSNPAHFSAQFETEAKWSRRTVKFASCCLHRFLRDPIQSRRDLLPFTTCRFNSPPILKNCYKGIRLKPNYQIFFTVKAKLFLTVLFYDFFEALFDSQRRVPVKQVNI